MTPAHLTAIPIPTQLSPIAAQLEASVHRRPPPPATGEAGAPAAPAQGTAAATLA
eukprot:CAMPEP_0171892326 /NCGR_PEP_ID=MMETSP0992-20121227/45243_1 /TAXON_ID=483369 /ORGANISM="non described non described, Strain CCMP2098" /LENGTH=54 /DNA_ID=CAMNT_0012519781 /DNA_START=14 /DNA_END=178 /DNA_ORIENTATION=+